LPHNETWLLAARQRSEMNTSREDLPSSDSEQRRLYAIEALNHKLRHKQPELQARVVKIGT
jgi:hypothetical protein